MSLQMDGSLVNSVSTTETTDKTAFWPYGWWKIVDYRIGILPLPIFVILIGIICYYSFYGKLSGEITMAIGLLAVGGFACGELGKRTPILNKVGAAAIFATFIPG